MLTLVGSLLVLPASAAPPSRSSVVRVVSSRLPVLGPQRELGAVRPARLVAGHPRATRVRRDAHPWQLVATIGGAVLRDVSFPTASVGYAVAELGQVWKTTNGGSTWTSVLNLGFPYYWYGVHAFGPDTVVISGFNNSDFTGLLRWTHDGGATWSDDLVIAGDGWSNRIRFVGPNNGLVNSIVSLSAANEVQYTTNGGGTAADWTTVVPDDDGGWFGADFAFLPDLTAFISGITECRSPDGGATWGCRPAVDEVFDGAVEYVNHRYGWVGGGSISPTVEGWVHRTTDGGATWSSRTLDGPWPIRDLHFLGPQMGWAAGGNVYSGVGGMYFTNDGGQTWFLDANTGAEMTSCTHLRRAGRTRIWCVGTTSSFSGVVYRLDVG
jgi:photosystem II stability/assembly factor-like uncharacterized protein